MAGPATPDAFYKIPSATDTWTALGTSAIKFNTIQLTGNKAAGTANTGSMKVRPLNNGVAGDEFVIETGASISITAPNGTYFTAAQFEIQSATSGDGLYALYSSAVVYDGP